VKKIFKRLGIEGLVIAVVLLVAVSTLAFAAYTAITLTSDVEVQEPISISLVEGDGTFDSDANGWDIGKIMPLDTKSIDITFANVADGPITLTLTANPASLDGGNLTFSFDDPAPVVPAAVDEVAGTATVTLTADTTQSLAPGNYSTEITVER